MHQVCPRDTSVSYFFNGRFIKDYILDLDLDLDPDLEFLNWKVH